MPSGIPWAWHIGSGAGNAGVDGAFGWEGGNQVTIQIYIFFNDLQTAIADLLGTNKFVKSSPGNGASTSNLVRKAPMAHPLLSHLYCSRIVSCTPMAFEGKEGFSYPMDDGNMGTGFSAKWRYWMLTCLFGQPKWNRTLSDPAFFRIFGANASEANRFCTHMLRPSSDSMNREGGVSFKWADGPSVGSAYTSNAFQILSKADYIIRFWRVPKFNALFSSATGRPDNILACIGCVNDATFLGYPAGTLACRPPEIEDVEDPVPPNVLGIMPTMGQTNVLCDVSIPLSFFDPPYYNAAYRGHNLAPIPGDAQGRWALVSTTGNPADTGIYPTANFNKLFVLPG